MTFEEWLKYTLFMSLGVIIGTLFTVIILNDEVTTQDRLDCLTINIDIQNEYYMSGDENLTHPYKQILLETYYNCLANGGTILK
jgi:hypothetical protein